MKLYDNLVIIVAENNMKLLDTRLRYGLTQAKVASLLKMPLRTYVRYEKDDDYGNDLKRSMMIKTIIDECEITEEKGLLTIDQIKNILNDLFVKEYKGQIDFCYLFGSYAKGYQTESSDVDLCVATQLTGFKFVGLSESIREALHKKVDLVRFSNLKDNPELLREIMKDGMKIYG